MARKFAAIIIANGGGIKETEERKMTKQHTPGPWEFIMEGDWPMIYSAALSDEGSRIPVVDLYHGGYNHEDFGYTLEANARLIAAAPEMLEVLRKIAACWPFYEDTMLMGRALEVIAKARNDPR